MTPETTVSSNEAPATGFFGRLMGVYFSPGETFKEIGLAPKVVLPLIIVALLGAGVSWLMVNRIGAIKIAAQGIEKAVADGKMTQEQANQQIDGMRQREGIIKASFPLIGLIGTLIMLFFVAGVVKLASMIFGTENTFMGVLGVTTYVTLAVSIVSSILFIALLYIKSPDEIDIQNPMTSNLASLLTMFMSKESLPKAVLAFASWIDVFSIWKIALSAIGYSAVSRRFKVGSAATMMIGLYLIAAVGSAIWAGLFG